MKFLKANAYSERSLWGIFFFLPTFTISFIWMAAFYPGLLIADNYIGIYGYENGQLSAWHSYPFSALFNLMFSFEENFESIFLFQAILFSCISAYLFTIPIKYKVKKKWTILLVYFFFLISPLVGAYFVSYTRDGLFSWLVLFFCGLYLELFLDHKKGKNISHWRFLLLCVLSGLIMAIRTDFLPIALVLAVSIFTDFKKASFGWKKLLLILIASHFIFVKAIPKVIDLKSGGDLYLLTLFINPLSHMLYLMSEKEFKNIPIQLKKDLEVITPFKKLRTTFDACEIPAFHQGQFNRNFNKEEFRNYRLAYIKFITHYPFHFFYNRINLSLAMSGFRWNLPKYYDDLRVKRENKSQFVNDYIEKYRINRKLYSMKLTNFLAEHPNKMNRGEYGYILKLLFFSTLIGTLLILVGIVMIRFTPAFSTLCLMLTLRTGLVYLLAPACQFKYIYSVYLFGFFGILFFMCEWTERNANSQTTVVKN